MYDVGEMGKLIASFPKKYCTLGKFPISILKEVSLIIAPILTDLFYESIVSGIFPDELKLGRIIPIIKGEENSSVDNYKPFTCKITSSYYMQNIWLIGAA